MLFLMLPPELWAASVGRVHCLLTVHCTLQVLLFCCFPASQPQHMLVHGVIPPQLQDLAFPSRDSCQPSPHPVEAALHGRTPLWCQLLLSSVSLLRVRPVSLFRLLMEMLNSKERPLNVRKATYSSQEVARWCRLARGMFLIVTSSRGYLIL